MESFLRARAVKRSRVIRRSKLFNGSLLCLDTTIAALDRMYNEVRGIVYRGFMLSDMFNMFATGLYSGNFPYKSPRIFSLRNCVEQTPFVYADVERKIVAVAHT